MTTDATLGYYARGVDETYAIEAHLIDPETRAQFDRFLTRVRRDAERAALTAFADSSDKRMAEQGNGRDDWIETTPGFISGIARTYRDTYYPEETP